nr:GlsB/YeaQ/YmgE family stress response membrane protein [Lachnospiraceae bacterium]
VGGLVFKLIGVQATNIVGSLLISVIGACICIWAGRKLFK